MGGMPGGGMMPPPPSPATDKAALDRLFDQMDADHNGQVSHAEFDTFHAAIAAMRSERLLMGGQR